MTAEEAQALVHEALGDPQFKYILEQFEPLSSEFFGFEALWPNPGGSASLGGYMVNPWNGEVWNPSDPCHLLTAPGLAKLQEAIRRRHKVTERELRLAHTLKPFCYEPDRPGVR